MMMRPAASSSRMVTSDRITAASLFESVVATEADVAEREAAAGAVPAVVGREVRRERGGQVRQRQRLQPHLPRTRELGEEQRVGTEQDVLDALDPLQLERH